MKNALAIVRSEGLIARDALGWLLFCGGLLWLVVTLGYVTEDAPGPKVGYLNAVFIRSFGNGFQAIMLAGLFAVPLHAAWTFWRNGFKAVEGYDRFGLWAQTMFTAMGFMGTIIGVSLAVAGLEQAMAEGEPGPLIGGLSTAFDTTFLGLSGAVLLMILRKIFRFIGGADA